jgi:hypothetical protein
MVPNHSDTDTKRINKMSTKKTRRAPSANLAPLAEILNTGFHIDISRDEPLIVQTETGFELPLSLLSGNEASEIKERACDQYVKSVLSGEDRIDQNRATLFFISQFCSRNGRTVLRNNPTASPRRTGRGAQKRADARVSVARSVSV